MGMQRIPVTTTAIIAGLNHRRLLSDMTIGFAAQGLNRHMTIKAKQIHPGISICRKRKILRSMRFRKVRPSRFAAQSGLEKSARFSVRRSIANMLTIKGTEHTAIVVSY